MTSQSSSTWHIRATVALTAMAAAEAFAPTGFLPSGSLSRGAVSSQAKGLQLGAPSMPRAANS